MSAVSDLHQIALDGAIWASAPPEQAARALENELRALLAKQTFTPHQHAELGGLLRGLEILTDRLEAIQ